MAGACVDVSLSVAIEVCCRPRFRGIYVAEVDEVAVKEAEERRGVRCRDSAMEARKKQGSQSRDEKELCGDGVVIDGRGFVSMTFSTKGPAV